VTGYRFYPLDGFPKQGLLVPPRTGKPVAAEFLTLRQAQTIARKKAAA
jgi:hypothetical protein